MKQILFFSISIVFIFVSTGSCELLIAVPDTSQAEDQTFESFFIKSTPATGISSQVQFNNRASQSQGQINNYQNQNINFEPYLQASPPIPPTAEAKSFNVFKNVQNQFDIGRSDKGGMTITIKLQPSELLALQGQGSNVQNTYSKIPQPTVATNLLKETATSATNSMIQVGNSIAEILNGGNRLIIAKPEHQASKQQEDIVVDEVPIFESNSFLKSIKNLIRSQISAMMDDTRKPSKTLQHSPSQQYALFTDVSGLQQRPQNQLKENVANFLTPKVQPQKFNHLRSQIAIAQPQNNLVPLGTTTTTESVIGDYGDNSSPIYTAASAIAKSVYQIPTNLDLMFHDMGRIYRKNLFQLRDSFVDMRSLMHGGSNTNIKINTDPWLDAYGA